MHIIQFLQHHFVTLDLLRVTPLLPKLVRLVGLMPKFEEFQQFKRRYRALAFKFRNDAVRGKRLEPCNLLRQVVRHGNPMQVVFHDHKTENAHCSFALQEAPRIQDDFRRPRLREERLPANDGAGEEVRVFLFKDAVATAAHWLLRGLGLWAGRV